MSVRDAAIQVLREAGQPLHADVITEMILSRGLWKTAGKTPAATVSARLYSDIKRHGSSSPFILHAPLTFGLRDAKRVEKPTKIPRPMGEAVQANKARGKTYSFTDSAERVLEEYGRKQPMHYKAITDKAVEMSWLATEGKTPEATMYAQILTEIKRHQRQGKHPRFVQHGKGFVGLSRWMGQGLAFEIEQHNRKERQSLHKRLLGMQWGEFEELIARLLAETGFDDIEVTSRSKDGGIDVRGTLVVGDVIRTRMAIQVKKWKHNVQAPVVQQVRGSLGTHERGLIITTSNYSAGAIKEASRPDATPVALMNGEQLVALMAEFGLGVNRVSHDILEQSEFETEGTKSPASKK